MRRLIPGRLASLYFAGAALLLVPAFARAQAQAVEKITFPTFDGVDLQGDWYPSNKTTKAPTALLVHKLGADRKQLTAVAEELQKQDFAVLALDLRGHGASTTVDPNLFWKVPANARAGSMAKSPKTIDFKNFDRSYYPFLINDLAAAKYFLEKKNNARECNVNDLVIVGAEDGATLVALWNMTEWDRRRSTPNPANPFQPKIGEPEGKDIAALVFLSLHTGLGSGNKWLSVATPLHQAFRGDYIKDAAAKQNLREKTGYCLIYGSEDEASAKLAGDVYNTDLNAEKNKLKLTYKVGLKTKLAGADLLGKDDLETEKKVTTYLKDRVFEARKSTAWEERALKDYPVMEVPLKNYGIPSP